MNDNWQHVSRRKSGGLEGRKALSKFYAMAETHRHAHFVDGMDELERRASGHPAHPDLDRQSAFAALVHQRADLLRAVDEMAEAAYVELRRQTQILWCCCFLDADVCDQIADMLEVEMGWLARADFIATLAEVRDALGAAYFIANRTVEGDPARSAHARLLERWELEAVAASFTTVKAKAAWIAQLGSDCLHEFVLNFDWDAEDVVVLHAVIDNPACDKATAMTLYALAGPEYYDALEDNKDGIDWARVALLDKIYSRVEAFGFGPSQFIPGDEMILWKNYRDSTLAAGRPMRWVFSDHAFEGFGPHGHTPRYVYQGESRCFMTPFERWSSIRLVSSR